jgi:iron(III) transport system substrate-binding protein
MIRKSLLAAAALTLAGSAAQAAAPTSVEEIANYKGADRQAVLEAGAKKEGALLIYMVGTQLQPLMDRFTQKYPYVKVSNFRSGSTMDMSKRAIEEFNANHNVVDGFELGSEGLIALRDLGILQSFTTPEGPAYDPGAIEPHRAWITTRADYGGMGYNTDQFPGDKAPKTWQELLKPEYKGKIGIAGSPTSSSKLIGILTVAYGPGYVEQLAKQNLRVYNITARAVANLVVTGEVPIQVRASDAHYASSQKEGGHVAWVAPGALDVTDSVVAIATKAPHPNAMMLMADFLLSSEGQKMYVDLGYDSSRLDMKNPKVPTEQVVHLTERPKFFEEYEEWGQTFNKVFKTQKN